MNCWRLSDERAHVSGHSGGCQRSILKGEAEALAGPIPRTRESARLQIFDYLETFYNPCRRHSTLGYLSPLDFEKQMFPPNQNPLT